MHNAEPMSTCQATWNQRRPAAKTADSYMTTKILAISQVTVIAPSTAYSTAEGF